MRPVGTSSFLLRFVKVVKLIESARSLSLWEFPQSKCKCTGSCGLSLCKVVPGQCYCDWGFCTSGFPSSLPVSVPVSDPVSAVCKCSSESAASGPYDKKMCHEECPPWPLVILCQEVTSSPCLYILRQNTENDPTHYGLFILYAFSVSDLSIMLS